MPDHLLYWSRLPDEVWTQCLDAALRHYREPAWTQQAHGRSLALLFFNPSLRTRASMELAGAQLGAHTTTITPGKGTWGFAWEDGVVMDGEEAEHIREAVGVLSRYYDALGVRAFASLSDYEKDRTERLLHTFADAAEVPVINLESAFHHPCQALGDAATLMAHFKENVSGKRFVLSWAPHPKALPTAVPNSAVLMASRLGLDVTVARPEGFALDEGVMQQAHRYAESHGTTVEETDDLDAALDGADVVYAKSWSAPLIYQDPDEEAALRRQHADWRITAERMARTREGIFMHCLPARRGVVVDDDVLDGSQALHLLQAEFRLHAQKAILQHLWHLSKTPTHA